MLLVCTAVEILPDVGRTPFNREFGPVSLVDLITGPRRGRATQRQVRKLVVLKVQAAVDVPLAVEEMINFPAQLCLLPGLVAAAVGWDRQGDGRQYRWTTR